jgi:hypothetical protein
VLGTSKKPPQVDKLFRHGGQLDFNGLEHIAETYRRNAAESSVDSMTLIRCSAKWLLLGRAGGRSNLFFERNLDFYAVYKTQFDLLDP